MLPYFVRNSCCFSFHPWFQQFRLESNLHPISFDFPFRKHVFQFYFFFSFRLSLSSNLPSFSTLINLFYFIQLRGKINYYLFISPIFNNLLTCLSIGFYDHLVIALPKGFLFVYSLFYVFCFITRCLLGYFYHDWLLLLLLFARIEQKRTL